MNKISIMISLDVYKKLKEQVASEHPDERPKAVDEYANAILDGFLRNATTTPTDSI